MKHLILGLGILAAIVCGCILSSAVISDRAERICAELSQAASAEERGAHGEARRHAARARTAWDESRRLFEALLSHEHVDEISLRFVGLPALPPGELRHVSAELLLLLENLAELERPLAHNVL